MRRRPKPRPNTSAFSLVEMVLAMSLIGLAMMVVIGLIPIGTNGMRNAMGESYSTHAADDLLSGLAAQVKADWTALNNIDTEGYKADVATGGAAGFNLADDGWTAVTGPLTNLYYKDFNENSGPPSHRVYRLVNTSGDVREYDAIIRIWKTATTAWTYEGGAWTPKEDASFAERAQLNAEFSWPASIPYTSRQIAYYSLEVSRQ